MDPDESTLDEIAEILGAVNNPGATREELLKAVEEAMEKIEDLEEDEDEDEDEEDQEGFEDDEDEDEEEEEEPGELEAWQI